MGQCGLVLYTFAFACCLLPFCVYSYSFAYEDGSEWTKKRCECDSVEFWLPRRTNGAPNLLSYEATASSSPSDGLLSKTVYSLIVRLWLPKQCEISFIDEAEILRENRRQIVDDGSIKIQFKVDSSASCLTATLKCKQKTLCIGIDTRSIDAVKATQRKLLMFKNDESKETFVQQPYSVLLSVVVFCSMIVLLALCGKTEKNSEKSVAHDSSDDIVTMVSSEKVKSTRRGDTEMHNQEEKAEVLEIKVEGSSNLRTDSNSNWSDVDLSSVAVTGDGLEGNGAKNSVDGAVFGKQKRGDGVGESRCEENEVMVDIEREGSEKKKGNSSEGKRSDDEPGKKEKRKEDKRKEKEVKSKERSKDMRSKRSHTAPAESTEQKSIIPKMRLSLKANTSSEAAKKEKKKSKKKADDDSPSANSPSANIPAPFSGDRRSFVNRELPKRPPGDNTAQRPSEEQDNSDEDENYETVVIPKGHSKNPKTLKVPSSNPPADRGSQNYDPDASLYDSVEDTSEAKPQGRAGFSSGQDADDTYEIVQTKASKRKKPTSTLPTPQNAAELYESVSGEYEQPNIRRQRSFSEITPSSTPRTDTERKVMSLGREKKPAEAKPTPPPLAHLHQIAHRMDDIDPYTVTTKKGDLIVQEEASIAEWKGQQPPAESSPDTEQPPGASSPEELDKMYAKVNREKQKKDRMETENEERTIHDGTEEAVHDGTEEATNEANGGGERANSVSVFVGLPDHQYETFPRESESFHETEDFQLYEEVDTTDSAKPKKNIAYV